MTFFYFETFIRWQITEKIHLFIYAITVLFLFQSNNQLLVLKAVFKIFSAILFMFNVFKQYEKWCWLYFPSKTQVKKRFHEVSQIFIERVLSTKCSFSVKWIDQSVFFFHLCSLKARKMLFAFRPGNTGWCHADFRFQIFTFRLRSWVCTITLH